MTVPLTTAVAILEDERDADFRLSSRQSDMLTTLNMLFDEECRARIEDEDCLPECKS